ncbi:MAG: hypothetical protein HC927_11615 [Deltaproteobacteria bacterium]|nr:hypothetical protein [Deltaproteobacteria bacterium]
MPGRDEAIPQFARVEPECTGFDPPGEVIGVFKSLANERPSGLDNAAIGSEQSGIAVRGEKVVEPLADLTIARGDDCSRTRLRSRIRTRKSTIWPQESRTAS